MNYQKYALAWSPGFVRRRKTSITRWLKLLKKQGSENKFKKWKVNLCQSLWGWGTTNSVANFLSLFSYIPVQEVGLPSPSVSQIKWQHLG